MGRRLLRTVSVLRAAGWYLAALLLAPLLAVAQGPAHLLKDINTLPDPATDSAPGGFLTIDGVTYFSASDGIHGSELWRTDRTAAGTAMVKDINPGEEPSRPSSLAEFGGHLYFVANEPTHGCGLWRSDGSENGTALVYGFGEPCTSSYGPISIGGLTVAGSKLFFVADDGVHGSELWVSDGTGAGTLLVKDINASDAGGGATESSSPDSLLDLNGTLLFAAADGVHGHALWASDGTEAGTRLVKEIDPVSIPVILSNATTAYLLARDTEHGCELWRSDGTPSGTLLVKEIDPGATSVCGSRPPSGQTTAVVNGLLAFLAGPQSVPNELWVSDGTDQGTVRVHVFSSLDEGIPLSDFAVANHQVFFTTTTLLGSTARLWRSDGTESATTLVRTFAGEVAREPGDFVRAAVGDQLFFAADDGVHGCALWASDGTGAGTRLVRDVEPGTVTCGVSIPGRSGPATLADADGTLLFSDDDGTHGRELWTSDGTESGTLMIRDINDGLARTAGALASNAIVEPLPGLPAVRGGTFFHAYDGEHAPASLWWSDGSEAGTRKVGDVVITGPHAVLKDTLLFQGDDGNGPKLWQSDGTAAGTARVDVTVNSLIVMAEEAYFGGGNTQQGSGLWKTDGTTVGTSLVRAFGDSVDVLGQVNGIVLFAAGDEMHGVELWGSDGSQPGTSLLRDIRTGAGDSSPQVPSEDPADPPLLDGRLFFSAYDIPHGRELWATDGTANGTVLVKDINPGPGDSAPSRLAVLNGTLWFTACDQSTCSLWRSDGSADGTLPVTSAQPDALPVFSTRHEAVKHHVVFDGCTEPLPGICGAWVVDGADTGAQLLEEGSPYGLTAAGDLAFFLEEEGEQGVALWRTDGTVSGTVRLGTVDSRPRDTIEERDLTLFRLGHGIVFTGYDADGGLEPWISDGTAAGTHRLQDIVPGPVSSRPDFGPYDPAGQPAAVVGANVFFFANDTVHGDEPWVARLPTLVGCPGDCNGDGWVTVDELVQGVDVILGTLPAGSCSGLDLDHSGDVTVDELAAAVEAAIDGCGG